VLAWIFPQGQEIGPDNAVPPSMPS